tara:strand:+ start:3377 stop:4195 length:819 start_codon:yes stop_codon:yes gene_type:complete
MKDFTKEFDKLLSLVSSKEPFAFSRFSDGEVTILRNKKLTLGNGFFVQADVHGENPYKVPENTYPEEERKHFDPESDSKFQKRLVESFVFKKRNYFKGIPPQNGIFDTNHSWSFCVGLYGDKDHEHLSFTNVMINDNYKRFIYEMLPVFKNKKIVLVSNENSDLSNLPFDIVKHFPIGSNCIKNNLDLVEECKVWIQENGIKDHIFLFSASSLSNILCYELYKDFDNNQYLDIGSSLGPFLKLEGWRATRDYLNVFWSSPNNPPAQEVDIWN